MTEEQGVKGGSIGAGTNALLTITTVAVESDATKSETFRVPYYVIDFENLKKLTDANFIRGFSVEKIDEGKPSPFYGGGQ